MAKFSLRRHDVQAQVSMVLSLTAIPCVLVMAFFVLRPLDVNQRIIPYNAKGMRPIAVYVSALGALALSTAGFGLGLNSAGQRRNDKPGLSWLGFFVGAAGITLTVILLLLFKIWGEPIG